MLRRATRFIPGRAPAAIAALGLLSAVAFAGDDLFASNAGKDDHLGSCLQLDGDTLVIGAGDADLAGNANAGEACVFVRSGGSWSQQALLKSSHPIANGFFGERVAIDGDTVLVGADQDSDSPGSSPGAAYVFVRSAGTWTEQARLVQPVPQDLAWFGFALAVQGDTAVVGAAQAHLPGAPALSGVVYVFSRLGTAWSLSATLVAPDAHLGDRFGTSVALDGETLLIGAEFGGPPTAADSGCAYVFGRSGSDWIFQQQLSDPQADGDQDFFGQDVALEGDTALVAARFDDVAGKIGAGSVLVYQRTGGTWIQQARLAPSDGVPVAFFGSAVALRGDRALVSAYGDDVPGFNNCGTAYLFGRQGGTWTQLDKLLPVKTLGITDYGSAAGLSDDELFVGQPLMPAAGIAGVGTVHVQSLAETLEPWADVGFALQGSKGPPRLAATGTLQPGASTTLALSNARAFAPAALIAGSTVLPTPWKGGLLAPGNILFTAVYVTNPNGDLTLSAPGWPAGLPPGTHFCFQFGVKDTSGPKGATLSNALLATAP